MKRVIITGGGSGIGSATARRAREDGFEVVTIDINGGDVEADLSDEGQTRDAVEKILNEGPVYGLVNNVGAIDVAELESMSMQQLEWSMRVNLQSTVVATQSVIPAMKAEGRGRVVNIASRAVLGKVGRTAYSAAKAAVLGASRTWALELGRFGITVNSVCPGPIRTAMFEAANPPKSEATRKIIDSVPLGKLGEPEEVAHAVAHFLDERASFVTGQDLYVCGGITIGAAPVL